MVLETSKKAFTLIELSIVLIIVSILITGIASVSITTVNNAKIKTTNDRMRSLYVSLGNFLASNNRLPCPASIENIKNSGGNYGVEVGAGSGCSGGGVTTSFPTGLSYGMLPVRSLGLPSDMAEDGFDNKFAYIVTTNLTTTAGFGSTSNNGSITIKEKYSSGDVTVMTDGAFAIVSYGGNKLGAFNVNSSSQNPTTSIGSDEQENILVSGSYDGTFVSTSGISENFDDIVYVKTKKQIISDNKAFETMPCAATTESLYGTTISWPQGQYDQVVVSTTLCPAPYTKGVTYPTKKCGAFGVWTAIVNPCIQ